MCSLPPQVLATWRLYLFAVKVPTKVNVPHSHGAFMAFKCKLRSPANSEQAERKCEFREERLCWWLRRQSDGGNETEHCWRPSIAGGGDFTWCWHLLCKQNQSHLHFLKIHFGIFWHFYSFVSSWLNKDKLIIIINLKFKTSCKKVTSQPAVEWINTKQRLKRFLVYWFIYFLKSFSSLFIYKHQYHQLSHLNT